MNLKLNRWVILEHLKDPKDPTGRHFDLLLEDGSTCRTWRLTNLPSSHSDPIQCNLAPAHDLKWLDINEKEVSGGRGFAKRFLTGFYKGALPEDEGIPMKIDLVAKEWQGVLEIDQPFSHLMRGPE